MKSGSKHYSKPHREQQIIAAANDLLIEVGANDFTIDQVVMALGIAKGTIYKYYASKDDILAEVSVKALTILLDYFKSALKSRKDLLEATKAMIMAYYQYYLDHPRYFELIIYMERTNFNSSVKSYLQISTDIKEFFIGHINNCQSANAIKSSLEASYCTYIIWGSCMGLMNFIEAKQVFIEDIEKVNRRELFENYAGIIVAGMTT